MAKKKTNRLHNYDVGGKKTKSNKTLELTENKTLSRTVLSNVLVKPSQTTKKETLSGEERICFFLEGNATVHINDESFTVQAKEVLLVPEGSTFYIENYSDHVTLHYNMVSTLLD